MTKAETLAELRRRRDDAAKAGDHATALILNDQIDNMKRERDRLALVREQERKVMPMIGPLMDAWEGCPNDLRSDMEVACPQLHEWLNKIAEAVE